MFIRKCTVFISHYAYLNQNAELMEQNSHFFPSEFASYNYFAVSSTLADFISWRTINRIRNERIRRMLLQWVLSGTPKRLGFPAEDQVQVSAFCK